MNATDDARRLATYRVRVQTPRGLFDVHLPASGAGPAASRARRGGR